MFTKLPPFLSIPVFYIFITISFLYRFLFGNIYGIFITIFIVYYYSDILFGITPLGVDGVMKWFVSQSESTKATLLASIVTVIGFLIAYATATANWKAQLLANLKVEAAGEIEVFFAEFAKLATDCNIYANALVEAVDKIQKGCAQHEAEFLASYNRDQGKIFLQTRQRIVTLSIEVHRLQGKYSSILISAPGLISGLNLAAKALGNIADKVWVNVPFYIQNDPNPIQSFVNQVNVSECMELKNAVDDNHDELNFSSGGVRGNLLSTVVGFNLWSLIYLYKEHNGFICTIIERYKKSQKSG